MWKSAAFRFVMQALSCGFHFTAAYFSANILSWVFTTKAELFLLNLLFANFLSNAETWFHWKQTIFSVPSNHVTYKGNFLYKSYTLHGSCSCLWIDAVIFYGEATACRNGGSNWKYWICVKTLQPSKLRVLRNRICTEYQQTAFNIITRCYLLLMYFPAISSKFRCYIADLPEWKGVKSLFFSK